MDQLKNRRILIVDDTEDIHEVFKCAFETKSKVINEKYNKCISNLFDQQPDESDDCKFPTHLPEFDLDSAFQGKEAIEKVKKSIEENMPYALVFLDVRMPPGIDGIETLQKMWEIDKNIEAIICTAYSDYNLTNLSKKLGYTHQLLLLKKPFEVEEIQQITLAQVMKWNWKMAYCKKNG
ncbi:MAG: hypothetical protein A2202_01495 [Bdellovibrionales bacterium RIFOXYA1_FULL_36_14]|nr:MAG: hypothetical protein A2202_01495 [Bdellovibrionales bacterium RIFOXYA1_FULL_36_14]